MLSRCLQFIHPAGIKKRHNPGLEILLNSTEILEDAGRSGKILEDPGRSWKILEDPGRS